MKAVDVPLRFALRNTPPILFAVWLGGWLFLAVGIWNEWRRAAMWGACAVVAVPWGWTLGWRGKSKRFALVTGALLVLIIYPIFFVWWPYD